MKILALLVAFAALAGSAFAAKDGWTDDLAKATAQAQAEQKQILLDFTGSDWCEWCAKLKAEVFSKPEFKDYAAKHLVLVEVDFPLSFELPEPLKKQNETLRTKYAIEGFPSVVVLAPDGSKKGQLGYLPGGPPAFLKELEKLK